MAGASGLTKDAFTAVTNARGRFIERKGRTSALQSCHLTWDNAVRGVLLPLASPELELDRSMTLTKAELAEMLSEKVGLNKREARDMVEAFFDEIRSALEDGEEVKLSGFGNFHLRDKPQRPGRNPKTGEEMPISARRVTTFHASAKLKLAIASRKDLIEP